MVREDYFVTRNKTQEYGEEHWLDVGQLDSPSSTEVDEYTKRAFPRNESELT